MQIEEQKQNLIDMMQEDEKLGLYDEPKQETFEEAAEIKFNVFQKENPIVPKNHIQPFKLGFINGAKWQQERMYSDLSELRNDLYDKLPIGDVDAFEILMEEQFKELLKYVNRFEVIDHTGEKLGRIVVRYGANVEVSFQDGYKTMKVFLSDEVNTSNNDN